MKESQLPLFDNAVWSNVGDDHCSKHENLFAQSTNGCIRFGCRLEQTKQTPQRCRSNEQVIAFQVAIYHRTQLIQLARGRHQNGIRFAETINDMLLENKSFNHQPLMWEKTLVEGLTLTLWQLAFSICTESCNLVMTFFIQRNCSRFSHISQNLVNCGSTRAQFSCETKLLLLKKLDHLRPSYVPQSIV